jgi:hypothetical protein
VTPAELRAEVWHAVIHGVRGVVYFPQQIGEGFRYDATPSGVALEMSQQNRRLNEMGAVLASEANPQALSVKCEKPLEVGWRAAADGRSYVIALNFSDAPVVQKRIELGGVGAAATAARVTWESREIAVRGGVLTDDFGPYEAKSYEIVTLK